MKNKYGFVAQRARETFLKIRELRKTMPQFTRTQKDQLESEITKLQDQWWDVIKQYMIKEENHEIGRNSNNKN